jgi:uncharacterized OB-fold protein
MQAYVKHWYERLGEGRISGVRCKRCGAVEFPPVPVCNGCSGTHVEWVDLSGQGTMLSVSASQRPDEPFAPYGPMLHAVVELAEGPTFISWLIDVDPARMEDIAGQLPAPVKLDVHRREDYAYPVFRLA